MHLLKSVNSSFIPHFWSHAFPLLLSKFCLAIFCLFIIFQMFCCFYTSFYIYWIYLHSTLYITVGICCSWGHVATRGQYRVPSSITLHIIFWDKVCHWTCILWNQLNWQAGEHQGLSCLPVPPNLGLACIIFHLRFLYLQSQHCTNWVISPVSLYVCMYLRACACMCLCVYV